MSTLAGATQLGKLVHTVRDALEAAGVEGAARDARLLVAEAAGLSDAGLIVREKAAADPDTVRRAKALAGRRASGEPVARIVGEKEFYGLIFALGSAALVPRPETELLVEVGLVHLGGRTGPRFLELGTGSGCIAISMLMHCPGAVGLATDASPAAVAVAARNAETYGLGPRLELVVGDWYAAVPVGARFDLIVSNPPYVETATLSELEVEVRCHDPVAALDGGPDGLTALRAVIAGAPERLVTGGMLAVEIGLGQESMVSDLCAEAGLESMGVHRDLAGHERVVTALKGLESMPR